MGSSIYNFVVDTLATVEEQSSIIKHSIAVYKNSIKRFEKLKSIDQLERLSIWQKLKSAYTSDMRVSLLYIVLTLQIYRRYFLKHADY